LGLAFSPPAVRDAKVASALVVLLAVGLDFSAVGKLVFSVFNFAFVAAGAEFAGCGLSKYLTVDFFDDGAISAGTSDVVPCAGGLTVEAVASPELALNALSENRPFPNKKKATTATRPLQIM